MVGLASDEGLMVGAITGTPALTRVGGDSATLADSGTLSDLLEVVINTSGVDSPSDLFVPLRAR